MHKVTYYRVAWASRVTNTINGRRVGSERDLVPHPATALSVSPLVGVVLHSSCYFTYNFYLSDYQSKPLV